MKKLGQRKEHIIAGQSIPVTGFSKAGKISLRNQASGSATFSSKTKKSTTSSFHLDNTFLNDASFSGEFRPEMIQLWTNNGANKIFRTQDDFKAWLHAPNPGLLDIAPIHFIKSDIKKIADLLGRILHGILA